MKSNYETILEERGVKSSLNSTDMLEEIKTVIEQRDALRILAGDLIACIVVNHGLGGMKAEACSVVESYKDRIQYL